MTITPGAMRAAKVIKSLLRDAVAGVHIDAKSYETYKPLQVHQLKELVAIDDVSPETIAEIIDRETKGKP